MSWDQVLADWQRFEPLLKSKWGRFDEDDLAALREGRDLLADTLERRYGLQRKHAELQATRWLEDSETKVAVSSAIEGS